LTRHPYKHVAKLVYLTLPAMSQTCVQGKVGSSANVLLAALKSYWCLQEVLELNFLFRRTNYPILLQATDTSNVPRGSIRQLCHVLRQQEVEEFVRYASHHPAHHLREASWGMCRMQMHPQACVPTCAKPLVIVCACLYCSSSGSS
jgi:hypothetical protein